MLTADDPGRQALRQRLFSPFGGRFWLWIYPRERVRSDVLGTVDAERVATWLETGDQGWTDWAERLQLVSPPLLAGSVTPGEQRALFALVRALRPQRILEIGTHVGGSTIVIAAALESLGSGEIVTVDVLDVNQPDRTPWPGTSGGESPRSRLDRLGLLHRVSFVRASALDFLAQCSEPLDLVFLDGSHESRDVYSEIARTTHHLRAPGYVVLHDYFPNGRPIGAVQNFLKGPYLAARRVSSEAVDVAVISLHPLPWPAAMESYATTLAIVGRRPAPTSGRAD